jgi:hypothetical protein
VSDGKAAPINQGGQVSFFKAIQTTTQAKVMSPTQAEANAGNTSNEGESTIGTERKERSQASPSRLGPVIQGRNECVIAPLLGINPSGQSRGLDAGEEVPLVVL